MRHSVAVRKSVYRTADILLSAKLLYHATLQICPGLPHGLLTTNADVISQDLLAFIPG